MIYYRVAFRVEQPVVAEHTSKEQVLQKEMTWRWRSTMLTSPHALFTLLRAYSYVPKENIRVFFASSESDMDEMLNRQNNGELSSSITADQFLDGQSINMQDVKRLEFELSTAPDHDEPYTFEMPVNVRELMAWTRMMNQVRAGELAS